MFIKNHKNEDKSGALREKGRSTLQDERKDKLTRVGLLRKANLNLKALIFYYLPPLPPSI